MSSETITREQKEKYKEAKTLHESNNDPETNPFKSKYESREIIQQLHNDIHKRRGVEDDNQQLSFIEAALEYQLGINYIYTEEVPAGEDHLKRVLELIEEKDHLNSSVVSVVLATYNELGVLWSGREQGIEKAYDYLSKAEAIYGDYKEKCDDLPLTIDNEFVDIKDAEKLKMFESLHTYTLYFLAQALKNLGKTEESAAYCMKTLKRQLDGKSYQAGEWAIHCAGLSQYFICRDLYWEGRHCLACAQYMIEDAIANCEDGDERAKLMEKKADVGRCWVKYCLNLLEESKTKVANDVGDIDESLVQLAIEGSQSGEDQEYKSSFVGFPLEVTCLEEKVPFCKVATFDQAKILFNRGKDFAEESLEHFLLDGFVTDHIEINQDISRLYQHIAFFEESPQIKCRMHKRRIDILESILNELNPQYYLAVCRQLQFELAEIYSDMMDLKYNISLRENTRQNPAVVKKINSLCSSSLKYYGEFLTSLKNADKTYPKRFEDDVERPALVAHFCSARLHSKLIPTNMDEKRKNVRRAFENYNFVVDYAARNPQCESKVEKELQICQDFVRILPSTLNF